MKGELKSLTIENLIILDDFNHSLKQSNINNYLIIYINELLCFKLKLLKLQVIFH